MGKRRHTHLPRVTEHTDEPGILPHLLFHSVAQLPVLHVIQLEAAIGVQSQFLKRAFLTLYAFDTIPLRD